MGSSTGPAKAGGDVVGCLRLCQATSIPGLEGHWIRPAKAGLSRGLRPRSTGCRSAAASGSPDQHGKPAQLRLCLAAGHWRRPRIVKGERDDRCRQVGNVRCRPDRVTGGRARAPPRRTRRRMPPSVSRPTPQPRAYLSRTFPVTDGAARGCPQSISFSSPRCRRACRSRPGCPRGCRDRACHRRPARGRSSHPRLASRWNSCRAGHSRVWMSARVTLRMAAVSRASNCGAAVGTRPAVRSSTRRT